MKKSGVQLLVALGLACGQAKVLAHTFPIISLHISVPHATRVNSLINTPVSGSSKAFYSSIKTLAGATIQNTVVHAPLTGISGQVSGVAYYSQTNATSGTYTNYYNFPDVVVFGSKALNNGSYYPSAANITSVANSISTGLMPIKIFPSTFGGHAVSGAQSALSGYYNSTATAGYNLGISMLQHPTGGLLFGTTYYASGTSTFESYPGFQAFGNNMYASSAVAQAAATHLTLSPLPTSYIQFGKITRPISNGFLLGTQYYPIPYSPPYGTPGVGKLYGDGYFGIAIGSQSLNTGIYGHLTSIPFNSKTFFK